MTRFRDIRSLRKATSARASIFNPFNQDRRLDRRAVFKQNRSAVLAKQRQLAA